MNNLAVGDTVLLQRGVSVVVTDIATLDDLCVGIIRDGYDGAGRQIVFAKWEIITIV